VALVNDSWRGIYQKLTLQLGQWQLLKVKKVRKRPDSEICSRLDGAQQMTILTREGQGPQAQISLWRKRIAQRFCDLINLTIPAHSWCEGSCNFGIGNQSLWKYLSFNSWQQWRKWAFDGVVVLYLRMSENMPDISLVRGSLTNIEKIGTISNIPHLFQLSHPSAINILGHVSLIMWSLFIFKWYTARLVV